VTATDGSRATPSAAQRWADHLAAWSIPEEILARAPQDPWLLPVELFRVEPDAIADTPSSRVAAAALASGGSVLDLGCGGGRAAFALVPPARLVIGVDRDQSMLDAFARTAGERGVDHRCLLGDWPRIEAEAPVADVVVAHHVAYNVADLGSFALAATRHARQRVVLELPERHPQSRLAPLWRHFWGLERPDGPTAEDALEVLREAGLDPAAMTWQEDAQRRPDLPQAQRVEFTRVRLCLPPERDREVAAVLDEAGPLSPRQVATIWWDADLSAPRG